VAPKQLLNRWEECVYPRAQLSVLWPCVPWCADVHSCLCDDQTTGTDQNLGAVPRLSVKICTSKQGDLWFSNPVLV
jgi:hypothetical protein